VMLVDEDVDVFDINDVVWAMTTRYQGDVDTVFIPGVRCHPLDPSSDPAYSPSVRDHGIACKTIFDCTVPYHLKANFHRSEFLEVDVNRFIPGFNKK
jgi:gallate decarboxylase subunit C